MRKHVLKTGSVLRKKGSGRPTKRTAENIEEVEQRIAETPKKSIRRLTQETNHLVQFSLSLKNICTFFPIVCLLCMKLNPLTIRAPPT
jgi:transposase